LLDILEHAAPRNCLLSDLYSSINHSSMIWAGLSRSGSITLCNGLTNPQSYKRPWPFHRLQGKRI